MKFITAHPGVFLSGLLLGLLLYVLFSRLAIYGASREGGKENKPLIWGLWAALGLFCIFGYVARPVYYEAYHGGSMGDNYLCAYAAVNLPGYVLTQHFYYPWVPARLFDAAVRLHLYSMEDPYLLEKAYPFFSLPHRLLAFVGLLVFAALMRRAGRSRVEAVLAAWLLAVSFGYWFWILQSNAMGMLLLFLIFALYATVTALQHQDTWRYGLAGAVTALCMFVHIASVYLCIGLAVAVVIVQIRRAMIYNHARAWTGLFAFCGAAAILGALYYAMVSSYYHTSNLHQLLASISDYGSLGEFHLDHGIVSRIIQDAVSVNLTLLLGLLQAGEKSKTDYVVMTLQLGLMVVWAIVFARSVFQSRDQCTERLPLFVTSTAFVICVIGFGIRKTWLQYYAPTTPLFVFLVTLVAGTRKQTGTLWIIGLILCTLYINGFSSTQVFAGEHVQDHPIYQRLSGLDALWPQNPVVYVDEDVDYYHNFMAIKNYYASRGHFAHIAWTKPMPLEKLGEFFKNPTVVVAVNADLYPSFKDTRLAGRPVEHRRLSGSIPVDLLVFPPAEPTRSN